MAKPGDIWILGRHRLMCGDSTKGQDITTLMNRQLADMYLTDPMYNVDYIGKTKDALKIENNNMSDKTYREFLQKAFTQTDSVMKPGAVFYVWHADSEEYNVRAACIESGWEVRQCLIWRKNSMVMARQDYHWIHEPCLYGWKAGAANLWASDRKQITVLEFDRPTKSKEHPTMKPVRMFDYQIRNNTKGQDIVFDDFAGSGTTIIACEQNGRIAYCMEDDPRYCDVIIKRYETLTGKKAKLLGMITIAKGKYQEWLEPDGLTLLEAWARDGLTDVQIASNIGIAAMTLYRWQNSRAQKWAKKLLT